jgi:cell wall-associated NlpC family hydrolase
MTELSDLIGKPYKAGARGPAAFDCWGLVLEVSKRAGIELPEIDVPSDNNQRGEIISEQKRAGFARLAGPEPYCLVLFRIIDDMNKIRWHVGAVLENCRRFIHTTGKMGVNISALDDPKWKLHIEGYYRYCRLTIDDTYGTG